MYCARSKSEDMPRTCRPPQANTSIIADGGRRFHILQLYPKAECLSSEGFRQHDLFPKNPAPAGSGEFKAVCHVRGVEKQRAARKLSGAGQTLSLALLSMTGIKNMYHFCSHGLSMQIIHHLLRSRRPTENWRRSALILGRIPLLQFSRRGTYE